MFLTGYKLMLSPPAFFMDRPLFFAFPLNSPLGLLHGRGLEAYVAQMGIMNNR
jgi:hypothetical protein